MTILELIAMARRRIDYLNALRKSAEATGDVAHVDRIDTEIAETQSTLMQLETLA